jgi:hypothetical protein
LSSNTKIIVEADNTEIKWYGGVISAKVGESGLNLPKEAQEKHVFITQSDASGRLKYFDIYAKGMQSAVHMDAIGTASGLVMLNPLWSRTSVEEKAKASDDVLKHPKFNELVAILKAEGLDSNKADNLSIDIAIELAPKRDQSKKIGSSKTSFLDFLSPPAYAAPIYKTTILEKPRYDGGIPLMPGGGLDGIKLPFHSVNVSSQDPGSLNIVGRSIIFQEVAVLDREKKVIAEGLIDAANLDVWISPWGPESDLYKIFDDSTKTELLTFKQDQLGVGVRDISIGGGPISGVPPVTASRKKLGAWNLNLIQAFKETLVAVGVPMIATTNGGRKIQDVVKDNSELIAMMVDCDSKAKGVGERKGQNAEEIIKEEVVCLAKPDNLQIIIPPVVGIVSSVVNIPSDLLQKRFSLAFDTLGKINDIIDVPERLISSSWLLYFLNETIDDLQKGAKIATIEIADINLPNKFAITCNPASASGFNHPDTKYDIDVTFRCNNYTNNGPNWYEIQVKNPQTTEWKTSFLKPRTQNDEFRLNYPNGWDIFHQAYKPDILVKKHEGLPSDEIEVVCDKPDMEKWGLNIKSTCTSTGFTMYVQFKWYQGGAPNIAFDLGNIHEEFRVNGSSTTITGEGTTRKVKLTVIP